MEKGNIGHQKKKKGKKSTSAEKKKKKKTEWRFAESEIKTIRHKYNIKFKRFESHPNHYLCPNSEIHTNISAYVRFGFMSLLRAI